MWYFAEFKYIRHVDKDCLSQKNLFIGSLNQPLQDCSRWCIQNRDCGGYTRAWNKCLFKNKSCKDDIYQNQGDITLFIKEGNKYKQILSHCLIYPNIKFVQSAFTSLTV